MAALIHSDKPNQIRVNLVKKRDEVVEKLIPRRCMAVSAGLIVAGLGFPLLMAIGILPATFLFSFAGFVLAALGGTLALVLCGEV
jgi:hypothetical protein